MPTPCPRASLGLAAALAAGALALAPLALDAQCVPAQPPLQPEDSLEMRTVVTPPPGELIKTIKVEKEVFICDLDGDGVLDTIRDVNLYTEVFENIKASLDVSIVTFEVITCDKDARTGELIACNTVIPGPIPFPVNNCRTEGFPAPPTEQCCQCQNQCVQVPPGAACPAGCIAAPGVCNPATNLCHGGPPRPPKDPVVLDAVVVRPDLVKSVHVEEEVFECIDPAGRPVIKLANIITEVIERLPAIPGTTLLRKVEFTTCLKDPFSGRVIGCNHRRVPVGGP